VSKKIEPLKTKLHLGRSRVGVPVSLAKVKQDAAQSCDINHIVAQAKRGSSPLGTMPMVNRPSNGLQPRFVEYPVNDYQEMVNYVHDIRESFKRLPARTRARFGNDPGQVVRFCENPENRSEAVRLGLMGCPEGQYLAKDGNLYPYGQGPRKASKADSEDKDKSDSEGSKKGQNTPSS